MRGHKFTERLYSKVVFFSQIHVVEQLGQNVQINEGCIIMHVGQAKVQGILIIIQGVLLIQVSCLYRVSRVSCLYRVSRVSCLYRVSRVSCLYRVSRVSCLYRVSRVFHIIPRMYAFSSS